MLPLVLLQCHYSLPPGDESKQVLPTEPPEEDLGEKRGVVHWTGVLLEKNAEVSVITIHLLFTLSSGSSSVLCSQYTFALFSNQYTWVKTNAPNLRH